MLIKPCSQRKKQDGVLFFTTKQNVSESGTVENVFQLYSVLHLPVKVL